ncbi:MAG TPA: pentapeptide repeat-containing protein [Candidatus Limnocylindria bacterium]|nr:pentapeptide repeat-containing protein [Candidatus Limnocylindria bacterium]
MQGVLMLSRVTVRDADFRRVTFDQFAPEGCTFEHCDFSGQTLDRRYQPLFSSRRQSIFRDCSFDGADLTGVRPGQARFERCSFADAKIDAWESFTAEFVDCVFAGRVHNVRFYGRPWGAHAEQLDPARKVNAFTGNDFRKADLMGVTFIHGVDIGKQRWPVGPQYVILDRIHQRIAKARVGVLDWHDHKARQEALDMLQAASLLYAHQMTVIGRRVEERWTAQPAVQERVWDALTRAIA